MLYTVGLYLWLLIAMLILAIVFPFVASYLLDGVLTVLRRGGVKALLKSIALTAVVGGIGYAFWKTGANAGAGDTTMEEYAETMRGVIRSTLQFTVPLALLGFAFRAARTLLQDRAGRRLERAAVRRTVHT